MTLCVTVKCSIFRTGIKEKAHMQVNYPSKNSSSENHKWQLCNVKFVVTSRVEKQINII